MDTIEIKGKWNLTQLLSRQEPESSTENEMIYAEGKNRAGFEKLQVRFGKNKEEMHRIIAALYTSL